MKDIKSILIGVFATTCLFLFIGATSSDGKTEYKYEFTKLNDVQGILLDKENGQMYKYSRNKTELEKIDLPE